MSKTYRELTKEFRDGKIHPLYLFYGSEKVLMQESVEALVNRLVPEDPFNDLRFHCDETPIQVAIEEAYTLPFLADHRFILVDQAFMFTGAKGSRIEHDLPALEKYLQQPSPHATVVFLVDGEKLDERKKITKLALQHCQVINFPPLKEQECREWIEKQVKKRGCRITYEAITRLLFYVGTNLQLLQSEIEKLTVYAGNNGMIDEQIVDHLVSRTIEQDVFVFVDEVVQVHTQRAFRFLYDLLKRKEAPIKLLFMITRQARILLQVKLLSQRGIAVQQMSGIIGVPPFVCKRAYEQGRMYTVAQLESILCELGDLDFKVKSGLIGDREALEMLLLQWPQKWGKRDFSWTQ